MTLFLVQNGPAYDAELMDAASDFTADLANDPDLDRIVLHSLEVPRITADEYGPWVERAVLLELPIGG